MTEICPVEKPICFRTEFRKSTKGKKEKIVFRCNGKPYDVLDALKNAYTIKTDPNNQNNTEDKINQCKPINSPDADPDADCSCINFDFAWITAIKIAESRIEEAIQTESPPSTPENNELAKTQIKEIVNESNGKLKIYNYFDEISKSMRNNSRINNGVNTVEINDFCNMIDTAIADANDITTKKAKEVEAAANKLLEDYSKPENINNKEIQNQFIYMVIYYFCYLDKNANADLPSSDNLPGVAEVDNLPDAAPPSNEEPVAIKKNDILSDIKIIYHVGTYVIDNSIHFDKNAFESTRDLFKNLYLNYFTSKNPNSGGGEQDGGTFGSRIAYGIYRLKGWGNKVMNYIEKNPIKCAITFLCCAASIPLPILMVPILGIFSIVAVIDDDLDNERRKKAGIMKEKEEKPLSYQEFEDNKKYWPDFEKNFVNKAVKVEKRQVIRWKLRDTNAHYIYGNIVFVPPGGDKEIWVEHIYDFNVWPDDTEDDEQYNTLNQRTKIQTKPRQESIIKLKVENKEINLRSLEIIENTPEDFKKIKQNDLLYVKINPSENNLIMKKKNSTESYDYKYDELFLVKDIIMNKKGDKALGIKLLPATYNSRNILKEAHNGEDTIPLYHPTALTGYPERYQQLFTLFSSRDPELPTEDSLNAQEIWKNQ